MIKVRTVAIVLLLWSMSVLASLSTIYNTATPGGGDDPRLADDEMRLIKAAIQERMNDHNGTADEGDHYWPLSTTQVSNVDTGQHRMVTLRQMTDNPSTLTSYAAIIDLGFLYQKDVSGNGELYWQDEAANVLQLTTNGVFNLNSAIWDGVFATSTADAGDSKSISLTSGGAYGVGRGAGIILYGNEHATNPGQLILMAGYSTGTTKAIINASSSLISNVVDPVGDQDASTKKYVDDTVALKAIFGVWNDRDGDGSGDTVAINTEYTAATDGIVTVYWDGTNVKVSIETPTGTTRIADTPGQAVAGFSGGVSCPVRRGDTWKAVSSSAVAATVYWMPVGLPTP